MSDAGIHGEFSLGLGLGKGKTVGEPLSCDCFHGAYTVSCCFIKHLTHVVSLTLRVVKSMKYSFHPFSDEETGSADSETRSD